MMKVNNDGCNTMYIFVTFQNFNTLVGEPLENEFEDVNAKNVYTRGIYCYFFNYNYELFFSFCF